MQYEVIFPDKVTLNCEKLTLEFPNSKATTTDVLKYLRLRFHTYEALNDKYFKHKFEEQILTLEEFKDVRENLIGFLEDLKNSYETVQPFTYIEAFQLENDTFKPIVFGAVNVADMIENLGHEMYKVDGKNIMQKHYSKDGEYLGEFENNNIYEVHKINGEKLGIEGSLWAVKCWCTTTNKEHWLWIEEQYKDDPLTAIASTFRVHKSVIEHIKCLKRQGDILMIELKDDFTPDKDDEIVALTKEQYFGLLQAQA